MATAKIAAQRRHAGRATPKRPTVRRQPVAKTSTATKRRSRRSAMTRTSPPIQTAAPYADDDGTLDSVRRERHGMIEEATEPPPSRTGEDIQRE